MNYYQKLSQPVVRAEMAHDWPTAASQWQTLLRRPAAHPWRQWIIGRVKYCRAAHVICPRDTEASKTRLFHRAYLLSSRRLSMAFQSPAQNYRETRLNLGDLVSLSPYSTYLMRSNSDFPDAGIVKGSVLAIDRALAATHGQLIVAEVEGELTLRRLRLKPVPALQAPYADGTVTLVDVSQPLPVWGVVAYALTDVAGLGFSGPAGE